MPVRNLQMLCPSTSLSSRVHHIICEAGVQNSDLAKPNDCCTPGGLLQWSMLETILPESSDTPEYFVESAKSLAAIFRTVDVSLHHMNDETFKAKYDQWLQWTSEPQLLLASFSMAVKHSNEINLAMLLITSVLERSLGDLYLMRGTQCPSMLKDLLVTPQLEQIFGHCVIQLLRVIIGPPISLNLRNVVWHGFPSPGEIPRQYPLFLLCAIASLGERLHYHGISAANIKHRPFITFPQMTLLQNVFPDIQADSTLPIKELFSKSDFILPAMVPYWELALQKYEQQRYGECVVVMLPQLEHGLRRVFASVNDCPERVLTAESTVLYTTFDEMLSKKLPNGEDNQLRYVIGDNYMDMLFDLLVYPEGPRVRDRISHGETCISALSQPVASHVMSVCLAFCLLFVEEEEHMLKIPVIQKLRESVEQYASAFHPISLLTNQILEVGKSVSQFYHLPRPSQEQLELCLPWEQHSSDESRQSPVQQTAQRVMSHYSTAIVPPHCVSMVAPFSDLDVIDAVLQTRLSTLYRGQETLPSDATQTRPSSPSGSEAEVIGLLRRIVAHLLQVSDQVKVACETRHGQWERKELRSRQRNTYKRMLDSVPSISQGLRLILLITLCHLYSMDDLTLRKVSQLQYVRYFKFILQCCENLKTNSSLDKNKWEESVVLVKDLATRTDTFYR